jgi:hypothetical protein
MAMNPMASERGWLKNGNLPGDLNETPQCGAGNGSERLVEARPCELVGAECMVGLVRARERMRD